MTWRDTISNTTGSRACCSRGLTVVVTATVAAIPAAPAAVASVAMVVVVVAPAPVQQVAAAARSCSSGSCCGSGLACMYEDVKHPALGGSKQRYSCNIFRHLQAKPLLYDFPNEEQP